MFTLLTRFIKKFFLAAIVFVQKPTLERLIQETSAKISKTAKIHPHLHYYSSNIYLLLSLLNINQRQYDKALEYCNMSIFHDPKHSTAYTIKDIISSHTTIPQTQLKQIILNSMTPKRLITQFDHLNLFFQKTYKDHLYYTANVQFHFNHIEKSIRTLKEYTKNHPKNLSALSDLGRALIHNQQYKEAITYLKKSIAPTKQNFASHLWLGTIYLLLDDLENANAQLLNALTVINSEHEQYHKNFSKQFFERARLYKKLGEQELSLNDLHKSLDLHRSNVDSLLLRSEILISRTNFIDASLDLMKVEEKQPTNKKAKKLKSRIKKHQRDSEYLG